MSLKYSIFLPLGVGGELASKDPVETYETVAQIAQMADELSYETAWLPDHFITAQPSQAALFESWTTAAALARDTKRVRIGHLVTGNAYRNPALQAKMASTLDVISHGRYTFGIGAGWHEQEFRAYGYEYPTGPERLRQLREAVQIILAMWTQEEAVFEGKYYQVRGAINQPKGVQKPHVPLLIAGDGERVTLKLVAQYADACSVQGDFAAIKHKFAVLKQHCEAVGRDYQSIRRTALTLCLISESDEQARALIPGGELLGFPGNVLSYGLIGTPETIRQRLAAYEEAGVQELIISFFDAPGLDFTRRFANEFIMKQ
ncbi:LLM class F420-dependent oxidoreductase [Ktedonosporobacter rubrisoli]|uniref:LLM class F420-dependent oxidoreductase n=1 Tax=Ktedonosporobacter rubrisoli TaxID=2509675 RepID=A0A4P6JNV7_KTERU|nr:LLM class F420-dependent oxidoreductase [Ktedonosporobacter rubrisoli]QBD76416.1 LLM class F420-dependent oxidoreductase [Ktedonosporobacter rubrisoli]